MIKFAAAKPHSVYGHPGVNILGIWAELARTTV
jgi:hypothetical protein